MPRSDQRTVTLRKDVYDKAKQDAPNGKVAGYVTELILKKTNKKGKEA